MDVGKRSESFSPFGFVILSCCCWYFYFNIRELTFKEIVLWRVKQMKINKEKLCIGKRKNIIEVKCEKSKGVSFLFSLGTFTWKCSRIKWYHLSFTFKALFENLSIIPHLLSQLFPRQLGATPCYIITLNNIVNHIS